MIVNFIAYKWGIKYGPEYVNRLFWSLLNTYSSKFLFYCITDDTSGLDARIQTINLTKNFTKVYTSQKIQSMDVNFQIKGNKVLLDLDVLIHI
jgi:hypothetical protein